MTEISQLLININSKIDLNMAVTFWLAGLVLGIIIGVGIERHARYQNHHRHYNR